MSKKKKKTAKIPAKESTEAVKALNDEYTVESLEQETVTDAFTESDHPLDKPDNFAKATVSENNAEPVSIDEHQVYLNVTAEYKNVKTKRENYKKYGPIIVIVTGIVFLTLMFSLENKIQFLILWVATDLFIVALMIYAEYKYEQFRRMLGLSKKEKIDEEE